MLSWSHLKPPDLVCSCLMSTERDFRILSQSKHVFPVPHVDVCECRTRDDCMNARLLNLVPYIAFNTTILWLHESLLSALRFFRFTSSSLQSGWGARLFPPLL